MLPFPLERLPAKTTKGGVKKQELTANDEVMSQSGIS